MGKIVQFKSNIKASKAYENLSRFLEVADSKETLQFYVEGIAFLVEKGCLSREEEKDLTEKARVKRIEISGEKMTEVREIDKPGVYAYTPEMGEGKPECQIEARRSYYGKHMYIDTPLELKGRGIAFIKRYDEKDFSKLDDHRVGWNSYMVTNKAFEKLREKYSVSIECCLD